MELGAFLNGGFQPKRYRPGGPVDWSGHLPFAHDLVVATRPELFVELGTNTGDSYFGFCQAVRENAIPCSCYSIANWIQEPRSNSNAGDAYRIFSEYNTAHYADFSYAVKSDLSEALAKFADGSVDLLHIAHLNTHHTGPDGFQSWLSKVKPGGIVLVHGVMLREGNSRACETWENLSSQANQFLFRHSGGLGVLRKNGSGLSTNDSLAILFDSAPATKEHVRTFYSLCATRLKHEHEGPTHHRQIEIPSRVYPFGNDGYRPETSLGFGIKAGGWEHVSIEVVAGLGRGALRIDLAERPCLIDVSGILLRKSAGGEAMWSAKDAGELSSLSAGGTLIPMDATEGQDFARFFSHGSDPQILLPALDVWRFDQPLILELWLRVQTDMASLLPVIEDAGQQRARIKTLEQEVQQARLGGSGPEMDSMVEERTVLLQQRETMALKQNALSSDFRKQQADLYVCRTDLKHKTAAEEKLLSELDHLEQVLNSILASLSWRLTAPIRRLSETLRGKR